MERDDASPLATALREIAEETRLDSASIELLRKGKPYSFLDESIGREWTIHPFAFRLKSAEEGGKGEEGITIDWEHEGWEWHDPLQVTDSDEFGGVPKLADSLRRVWPECDLGEKAAGALTEGLRSLQNDHESGARQLAAKAVAILRHVISGMDAAPLDQVWWSNIRMAAWHLWKNGRESMGAAIASALLSVLDRIEAIVRDGDTNEKLPRILDAIDGHLLQRDSAVRKIRDSFVEYIKNSVLAEPLAQARSALSVLTLSSSSTISGCLLEAAAALNLTLDLRILESRPLCEGVTLASKILADDEKHKRTRITIYSDASAALAAEGIDLILLGADRISSVGDVSNKTGSLPAVLSTRHVSPEAKVVVLSEVEKVAGPGTPSEHAAEDNEPSELMAGWTGSLAVKGADAIGACLRNVDSEGSEVGTPLVKIKNIYFEWVPSRLVSVYITDEGVWSAADVKKRSDWVGAETHRLFEDVVASQTSAL